MVVSHLTQWCTKKSTKLYNNTSYAASSCCATFIQKFVSAFCQNQPIKPEVIDGKINWPMSNGRKRLMEYIGSLPALARQRCGNQYGRAAAMCCSVQSYKASANLIYTLHSFTFHSYRPQPALCCGCVLWATASANASSVSVSTPKIRPHAPTPLSTASQPRSIRRIDHNHNSFITHKWLGSSVRHGANSIYSVTTCYVQNLVFLNKLISFSYALYFVMQ